MTDTEWENIITVLGIAVLVDHRLRDPELVEFCHEAKRLSNKYRPDVILTRTKLRNWFFDHRLYFDAKLKTGDPDHYMEDALKTIQGKELRSDILLSIFGICICDYHLDDEEAFMLKMAVDLWGQPIPSNYDEGVVA